MSYINTIGFKQNNWGNLRGLNINWVGTVPTKNGYHAFDTPENGVRALFVDLMAKMSKGKDTIEEIISMYAPKEDNNDTEKYIKNVSNRTELHRKRLLTYSDLIPLAKAIIFQEIGLNVDSTDYTKSIFTKGWKTAFSSKVEETVKSNSKGGLLVLGAIVLALLAMKN